MLLPKNPAPAFLLAAACAVLSAQTTYQKPPKEIVDVLTTPPPALISVSPSRDYAILMEPVRFPSIAEVAQPMARLAGLRIDVHTNGLHLAPTFTSFLIKRLSDAADIPVSVPSGGKLGTPVWSPDGKQFAFTHITDDAIELWVASTSTGDAHVVPAIHLNGVTLDRESSPVRWLPDSQTLLVRLILANRGPAPAAQTIPAGPDIQESMGHAGPVRTWEDMLSSPHDEDLFDYYARAQLALVTPEGRATSIGEPAIFGAAEPSPDGNHLLVSRIQKPYSYLHPAFEFPTEVEVWSRAGQKEFTLASLHLADRVPINGVRTGPRGYQWLPQKTQSLVWAEAMDGGNPKEKVPHRDRLVMVSAPFKEQPHEIFETVERFRGLHAIDASNLALVEDFEQNKRWLRTIEINLDKPGDPGKIIFARNLQDRYKDPGTPVMKMTADGGSAILQVGNKILLASLGASPVGDRPFLDRFDLSTQKSERLFQSSADSYEAVEAVLDAANSRILTRRESPNEPPNFYIRSGSQIKQLTHYTDPNPQLRKVSKKLVTYNRADGVPLSFTLYLPPDYKPGTRLPTIVWAYPLEYNDADTAGQVSGSTERFTALTGHLLFLLHGYAVLENAAMPIVGDPETVNNTYVQQIVMDAKAAIDKAVEMGVADRDRVGVGGHSYGAFMTANLLAHSTLFRAGMAESGAYNRTLTPFGFQSERRTFWEAPEVYMTMSPFANAQKIKAPLLMIHGEADDNQGTFPIQSDRMYQAIRGNGGTVRLVMLPAEAHAYRALETNEHVLYEELTWMDKYLKGDSVTAGN